MTRRNGTAADGNGSLELPLVTLPGSHPCSDCGQCCRYVATQIDDPSAFREYENIFWYLTHRDVSVYIDHDGDWYLEFRTVCRHLAPSGTCGIYVERPLICEEYSWEECEVTTREPGYRQRFESHQELLDWMRVKRPKGFERYMRKRRELLRKREVRAKNQASAPAV